jgi:type IV pilus assembly protein PilM
MMLNKHAIGLDITDHSITVVELVLEHGRSVPVAFSRVILASGIVERGVVKDEERLIDALDRAFEEAYPSAITAKTVVFGIPDTQVYLHTFEISAEERAPGIIDESVEREIDATIPLSSTNRLVSVVSNPVSSTGEMIIVAVAKSYVEDWRGVLHKAGITACVFDIPAYAILRSIYGHAFPKDATAIVDIGANTTSGIVFDASGIRYSYSIPFAGRYVTEHVSKHLHIPLPDAERQKQIVGFSDVDDPIFAVLGNALEPITKSLLETFDYLARKRNITVSSVVLMGGTSELSGAEEYFKTNLSLEVVRGVPNLPFKILAGDFGKHPEQFIIATGLALRLLEDIWAKDPQIVFPKEQGHGLFAMMAKPFATKKPYNVGGKYATPQGMLVQGNGITGVFIGLNWFYILSVLLFFVTIMLIVVGIFLPNVTTYKQSVGIINNQHMTHVSEGNL